MIRALLTAQPRPPSAPAVACPPKGSPSPEWHELRLFGRGRHPVNFDAGRERVVEV
jgi:hypothetical protein